MGCEAIEEANLRKRRGLANPRPYGKKNQGSRAGQTFKKKKKKKKKGGGGCSPDKGKRTRSRANTLRTRPPCAGK